MYCENCGKQIADGSSFCENCGAKINQTQTPPVMEQQPAPSVNTNQFYSNPNPQSAPFYTPAPNPEEVVSAGGYIWRNIVMGLVAIIPVIGFIINIILLCVWMGDKTKQESFRNWAKASLIMTIIGIVLSIVIAVIVAVAGIAIGSSLADYTGGYYGYY